MGKTDAKYCNHQDQFGFPFQFSAGYLICERCATKFPFALVANAPEMVRVLSGFLGTWGQRAEKGQLSELESDVYLAAMNVMKQIESKGV